MPGSGLHNDGWLSLSHVCICMQAINHDKSDLDAKWDKAVLHDTIGEPRKASDALYAVTPHAP